MADTKQVGLSGRKLFIAIPTYDGKLNIKTAYGLARLMPIAAEHGVSVVMGHLSGCSIITVARNALVYEFISTVALADKMSLEFNISDHGVDMEIEFTDDAHAATGAKLYLQLKSGDSYLCERVPRRRNLYHEGRAALPVCSPAGRRKIGQ